MSDSTRETTRPVDAAGWDRFKPAKYLSQNLVDPGMDIDGSDEFGDIDNEFAGLTIVEPEDAEEYLRGYGI